MIAAALGALLILGSPISRGSESHCAVELLFPSLEQVVCGAPEQNCGDCQYYREGANDEPFIMVHIEGDSGREIYYPAGRWTGIIVLVFLSIPILIAFGVRAVIIFIVALSDIIFYLCAISHLI